MPGRPYRKGSGVFIAAGIVIMVFAEMVLFSDWRPRPPDSTQPADGTAITIRQDRPSGGELAAPMSKPDFAPPHELETDEALLKEDPAAPEIETLPAWKKFSIPSAVPQDRPRVAIIIDDMGMDRAHTQEALDLPGPVTMAFLPYAGDLKAQTEAARAKGHELMVHVPMAPIKKSLDAGPAVLAPEMSPEQFMTTLAGDLAAFDGYVGINNHMGSRMTQDRAGMERLMPELAKRGLLFIDSRTINTSVAAEEAEKAGIPFAARDVFLDHEETYEAVEGALAQVERKALKDGLAIAIGHPKKDTLQALREWLPTLEGKGIFLVPVSAAVRAPAEAFGPAASR